METSNHLQGMRENLQKMQDIEQQRQNEEDDRQRNLAMISYKASADILSDAERYKFMSDDEIAKHAGIVLSSSTILDKLGVKLSGTVESPMPAYISKLTWDLCTNPATQGWSNTKKLDKLRSLGGKYYEEVRAKGLLTAKLQTPQEPQVTNQQDIDSANKSNSDAARQQVKNNDIAQKQFDTQLTSSGFSAQPWNQPAQQTMNPAQFQDVPKPIMSERVPSLYEQEAEQIFGGFDRSEDGSEHYKHYNSLTSAGQHALALLDISPSDRDYFKKFTQAQKDNPDMVIETIADNRYDPTKDALRARDAIMKNALNVSVKDTNNAIDSLNAAYGTNFAHFTGGLGAGSAATIGKTEAETNYTNEVKTPLGKAQIKKTEAEIKKLDNDIKYRWAQLTETQRNHRVNESQGDERLAIAKFSANTARAKLQSDIKSLSVKGELTENAYISQQAKYKGWTLVTYDETVGDNIKGQPNIPVQAAGREGLALLDEMKFVKATGVNEIASILRKKRPLYGKDPKVTGTSAVAFVSGALDGLGVKDPDTKKALIIKYMNAYFWEKK